MNAPLESEGWAHLLIGLLDTDLTSDGLVALRQELRQDGAVDTYVDYISLHALLEWRFGMPQAADLESQATPVAEAAPSPPPVPHTSPLLGFLSGAWSIIQSSPRALLMILAGLLAGYFVVVMALVPLARRAEQSRIERGNVARQPASVSPPGTDVGALAAGDRTRWSAGSSPPQSGRLRAGERYQLADGRVEMTLAGGIRVWVDGPAEFEPQSGERVRLLRGKLSAQVPPPGRGFTVATPLAEVIDLGTEFGVEVDGSGKTDIHVLLGEVEVKPVCGGPPSAASTKAAGTTKVVAGQAVRVTAAGEQPTRIPVDRRAFAAILPAAPPGQPNDERVTKIWLSNLFDDRPHVPLAEAMRTDTYGAEADFNDLGVSRVIYGGPPLVEIAPDIKIDLTSVGWQGEAAFKVSNDGMNDASTIQGLRLAGNGDDVRNARIEDGIGMHANSVLTFSLPELRTAWKREGQSLQFVCDAAGVNDGVVRRSGVSGSVHLIVIVSSRTQPLAAIVDGVRAELGLRDGHPFVRSTVGAPLTAGGRTFRVNQLLGPDAEYLTLVCTSAGDGINADHGAWIGARLEVAR